MSETPRHEWATPRPAGAALLVGGLALIVAGAFAASDPVGLTLIGVAGLMLAAFGTYALLVRPRLALSGGPVPELTVRTIAGTRVYPRDRVERIRLLSMRRVGRRVGQLELDVLADDAPAVPAENTDTGLRDDTRLVVFSRWDLGADLLDVADALRAAGFPVEDTR
ncbi:PH domain-containing protein [Gordonia sinesedis]